MKRNVLLTLITVVIILWATLQTSGLDSVLDDKGQYNSFALAIEIDEDNFSHGYLLNLGNCLRSQP